jgi:hypothetical protein
MKNVPVAIRIDIPDLVYGERHCYECYEFERDNFDGIQD